MDYRCQQWLFIIEKYGLIPERINAAITISSLTTEWIQTHVTLLHADLLGHCATADVLKLIV